MKRIITSRGGGKTRRLIQISSDTNNYIVAFNPHDVADQANKMNVNIPFPLTYDEFLNGQYNESGINGVLIDNAEMLIQHMSKVPVKAVSISIDDE